MKKSSVGPAVKTVLLGAGASRGVSYRPEMQMDSPLDSDFYDLLLRLHVNLKRKKLQRRIYKAKHYITDLARSGVGENLWGSMEKLFYSSHVRETMRQMIEPTKDGIDSVKELEEHFAVAIQSLLPVAHGTERCDFHQNLFQRLSENDAVVTFNYDLVAERALRALYGPPVGNKPFGPWLYNFEERPPGSDGIPLVYKLHGSVNWDPLEGDGPPEIRQERWEDFDPLPGYTASRAEGFEFPLLLPYWDKKIEANPWKQIWCNVADHLRRTECLIIWGYSLPLTDLKAQELLRLTLISGSNNLKSICVIDPNPDCRLRWRRMFVGARFWGAPSIEDFFDLLTREKASALDFGAICP